MLTDDERARVEEIRQDVVVTGQWYSGSATRSLRFLLGIIDRLLERLESLHDDALEARFRDTTD